MTLEKSKTKSRCCLIPRNLRNALLFLSLFPWIAVAFAQPAPKVAFLAPDPPGASLFWTQVIEVMQATAEDLAIDLQITYSKPTSYKLKKDGMEILKTLGKSDYFLSGYWPAVTKHHLKQAEQRDVRTFIFNSGVIPEDRKETGQPREKYRYWIGQIIPDDRQAGYLLADILINKAKAAGKTDNTGKVHLISIGGFGDGIEETRSNALKMRIAEQNDAVLDQAVLAGWSQTTAYNELLETLGQRPKTGVVWSISDAMALGAVEAAKDLGKVPGRDIFIGGIDWSREALEAVKAGEMAVSMGGHFLEGAKALILVHDYHYGSDFADELGVEMQTQLRPITIDNIEKHLAQLSNLDWREIDFRQFSKKYNSSLKNYDLSLDALLKNPQPESAGRENDGK